MNRICVLISSLHGGGAEKQALGLITYLEEVGHEVHVLTFEKAGRNSFLPDGVEYHPLDLFAVSSSDLTGLKQFVSRILTLRDKLRNIAPDLSISFMTELNILTGLALIGSTIPWICLERANPRTQPLAPWRRVLRRFIYPKAHRVIVQTHSVQPFYQSWCNTVMLPNFVLPPAPHKSRVDYSSKRIIWLGRLAKGKGVDIFLDALTLIREDLQGWEVEIWGEGPLRDTLERKAYDVGDLVCFKGYTDRPLEVMSQGSLFVFTSLSEGFPNSLLEAMAVGLAVISFDCDFGPKEFIRHQENGVLVPTGSISELARAIRTLCRNEEVRTRLGQKALAVGEAYSFHKFQANWESIIHDALI